MSRNRVLAVIRVSLLGLAVVTVGSAKAVLAQVSAASTNRNQITVAVLQEVWDLENHELSCSTAFAEKADAEGYAPVASLFRAAAASQRVHIRNVAVALRKLGGEPRKSAPRCTAGSTAENLRSAAETHERYRTSVFPQFLERLKPEGFRAANEAVVDASEPEATLAGYYQEASSHLSSAKSGRKQTYYVCSVCGYMTTSINFHVCKECFHFKEKHEAVS